MPIFNEESKQKETQQIMEATLIENYCIKVMAVTFCHRFVMFCNNLLKHRQ